MSNMNAQTQKLINALQIDQADALASDFKKIREMAADKVRGKIYDSNLAEDLKKSLSDYVMAQLLKKDF
jgi:hypothetical protein